MLSRLRQQRKDESPDPRAWDLTRAAARIGISASSLVRYEKGDVILPISYLRPIAVAYGVSARQLAADLGLLDEAVLDEADRDYTVEQFCEHLVGAGLPADVVSDLTALAAEQRPSDRKSLAEGYARIWERLRSRDTPRAKTSSASTRQPRRHVC